MFLTGGSGSSAVDKEEVERLKEELQLKEEQMKVSPRMMIDPALIPLQVAPGVPSQANHCESPTIIPESSFRHRFLVSRWNQITLIFPENLSCNGLPAHQYVPCNTSSCVV